MAQQIFDIPVIRIDDAMAEAAVRQARKIGVLAQASMARVVGTLSPGALQAPVFASPELAVEVAYSARETPAAAASHA